MAKQQIRFRQWDNDPKSAPSKGGAGKVLVRTAPGKLEWVDGTGLSKGAFTGRAGTKRRSRKGNVTTLPNGRRDYHEEWWGTQVVAY